MNRRLPFVLAATAAALAAALAVSACSTFDSNVAARVNGSEITDDTIEFLLHAGPDTIETSYVKAGSARSALGELVKAQIAEGLAASLGVDLTPARAETRTRIESSLDDDAKREWSQLSSDEQNLVLDLAGATSSALANAKTSPPSNLEQLYAEPEQTGFMCLRYMTFEAREQAEAASAQLASGTGFADLANQLSPTANGGILNPGGQGECVSMESVLGAGPDISGALLAATPGVPTPIVTVTSPDSPTGQLHYIFVHRPYSEIAEQLSAAVAQAPQFAALQGAYSSADVSIASKYGKWDDVTQSVVPLD